MDWRKNPKEQKMAARAPETATQWDSMRATALTSTVGSCSLVSAMLKEVGSSKGRPATRSRKGEKAGIRELKRLAQRGVGEHIGLFAAAHANSRMEPQLS